MKRYPVLTMLGICIVILIFAPIIWGDRKDAVWKFIYNFQSLLTGLFAIVAALITVHTMRETDDRQEVRHQELMSLNLRRDKMIIRRAVHPQILDLGDPVRFLDGGIALIKGFDENDAARYFQGPEWSFLVYSIITIDEIIGRKQMTELEPLLPPNGLRAYQITMNACSKFKNEASKVDNNLKVDVSDKIVSNFIVLKKCALEIHLNIHKFREEIANLANEYGVT